MLSVCVCVCVRERLLLQYRVVALEYLNVIEVAPRDVGNACRP